MAIVLRGGYSMKQLETKLFIIVIFLSFIMLLLSGCIGQEKQSNNIGKYQVVASPVIVIRIDTVTGNSWMLHVTSDGTKQWVLIKEPYDSNQ